MLPGLAESYYKGTALKEALQVYAEFHILEGKTVEWNKEQSVIVHTFVSGSAVTIVFDAPSCASQA